LGLNDPSSSSIFEYFLEQEREREKKHKLIDRSLENKKENYFGFTFFSFLQK